ncbi:YjjG family noncanonical pyrimidine nucleotidase [Hymenobacter properus]|uniref:Noncanonical pyrimidine nucleotidase, YjjG family n=1 Tax=Hymenobacter properus TaxID=2791026 RepID=A0A931FMD4_9BACT|nr:YjjG family noncanonical pyrimidine nucleotidase [Hymenobacter properus]MBF9143835.1 noncanonical pyrimidine nucleotidase, YjjG family [Hymenobacter properus]MBR7722648.1 YjjG family noncanonical pyrimidine nucleotidase [Microvirga sp. SRT04]
MKYRHLFFDLDHTLWDFEKNANDTLHTLYERHDFARFGTFTAEEFIQVYSDINHALWRMYQSGKIKQAQLREVRFTRTLTRLGVPDDQIPANISDEFTDLLPLKSAVFPYTHEVLDYLKTKYRLHLITNGFNDIQAIKLASSNLAHYFEAVITSEHSGHLKPDPRMFAHALAHTGATAAESLMIGDNLECDVLGACNAGIDQVYFNPDKRRHFAQTTHEISCLSELKDIL